jgi:hypothetical protein
MKFISSFINIVLQAQGRAKNDKNFQGQIDVAIAI